MLGSSFGTLSEWLPPDIHASADTCEDATIQDTRKENAHGLGQMSHQRSQHFAWTWNEPSGNRRLRRHKKGMQGEGRCLAKQPAGILIPCRDFSSSIFSKCLMSVKSHESVMLSIPRRLHPRKRLDVPMISAIGPEKAMPNGDATLASADRS